MLLHLVPKFLDSVGLGSSVTCLSFEFFGQDFTIKLVGGKDITTRKPYPNKRYSVVCRKKGQRAINGLFLEVPKISTFSTISHWRIDDDEILFHKITYSVTDTDYEAASDDMLLWYGTKNSASRCPKYAKNWVPAIDSPVMCCTFYKGNHREGDISYGFSFDRVCMRTELFSIPTIPTERLLNPDLPSLRLPEAGAIFRIA